MIGLSFRIVQNSTKLVAERPPIKAVAARRGGQAAQGTRTVVQNDRIRKSTAHSHASIIHGAKHSRRNTWSEYPFNPRGGFAHEKRRTLSKFGHAVPLGFRATRLTLPARKRAAR